MIEIEITRVSELPDDIGILAAAAYAEGYRNIRTLVREFIAGENRFQGSGECLFTAHGSGELVGIGGLNIDPYQSSETVARVRRL